MAGIDVILTETVQLSFTVPNLQNYYWDMTGATKVAPYQMVRDTIDTGKDYRTHYLDIPADTTIQINHNTTLDVDIFDQDRLALFYYYGKHVRDVFDAHLQFPYFVEITNPDVENTLRVYIQWNGAEGTAINFYTEEISTVADETKLLSRLEKGSPLNNSDIDHITAHIKKSIFEKYEAPMKPIKKYVSSSNSSLVGGDLYGTWKVELMNDTEYRVFMVNMPTKVITQVVGTGGGLAFFDKSWFEGKFWLCSENFTGWAVCTPMQNIYLSRRPNMRFLDSEFSIF